MKNYFALVRTFFGLMGIVLLIASCADSDLSAAQPQVVRKKIEKIGGPAEALPLASQTAVQPVSAPNMPAAEQAPLVAGVKPPEAPAPSPAVHKPATPSRAGGAPAAVTPSASIVETIRPVVATQPPVPAPEPQVRKLETALAVTDSQVAALLNLQAQAPYNPKGKVDPFTPLLRDEPVQAAASKLMRKKRDPQSPLEKIDLGQLKLVAIIAAPSGNRALVEESTGKGYILREGTYVGLNSGKVVNIAIDKVMVEEEFEDAFGKTITQKKEITLPKPPGEL